MIKIKKMIEEGINDLIPKDSYIFKDDYKTYRNELSNLWKEYNDLKNKLANMPKSKDKPKEEWDSLEKFMYDEFGDIPKYPDSEDLKKLKDSINITYDKINKLNDIIKDIEKQEIKKRNISRSNISLPKPTTKTDFKGFTILKTGVSYYDNFLNDKDREYMEKHKGLTGYISEMSPMEYLQRCADIFNSTFEKQIIATDENDIRKYSYMMRSGTKFNLPYLNYADNQQEGRHRAQAAILANIDTIPVLIVIPY